MGVFHGFARHARETLNTLLAMHENMEKQFEGLGGFYAFDPQKVSMEDFFGDLNDFRTIFLVRIARLLSFKESLFIYLFLSTSF